MSEVHAHANAATRHLQQILEYLQSESAGGAITIRRRILETVRRVGQMPFSGRVGRIGGTREAVVPRSPFILVYEISERSVAILGIWHAARAWHESFEAPNSP
jgi:toxin ParE1/3/4